MERVLLVNGLHDRVSDVRELKAHEASTRFENTVCLAKSAVNVRDIANTKGNGVCIKGVILKLRELLGVALNKVKLLLSGSRSIETLLDGTLTTDAEHAAVDVTDSHVHGRVRGRHSVALADDAEGNITSAASYINGASAVTCTADRQELRDELIFPHAMKSTTHEIIHDIVLLSNAVKHAAYKLLLVINIHVAETKVSLASAIVTTALRSAARCR
mmetsp:Transcript_13712/g.26555  ORF Transcript_13712/g.26555 Transcript_13712/m.26555 type:complete len:216 (-) Transcript_13712:172-819(-)